MHGKIKMKKLLTYNIAANKLIYWISLMGQNLNIMGVTNGNNMVSL